MGVTIIGRLGTATPAVVHAPLVFTKSTFASDWQLDPTISAVSLSVRSSGQGLGSCELRRRFGFVKEPHEPATALDAARDPLDLQDAWVRVSFVGPQGVQPAWIGRISSERRRVFSEPVGSAASGIQTWVAHEPLQELRKISVSRSFWFRSDAGGALQDLGWLPPMNARDRQTALVGNRSASVDSGSNTYVYGGNFQWSNLQYLRYVLAHFVDDSALGNDPAWFVGGQSGLLSNIFMTLDFGDNASVASIIRKLIPVSMGIDFTVVEVPESPSPGFEIQVYALTDQARTFRGVTLPLNPNTVTIEPAEFPEAISVDIVRTLDQQYDRINVIGGRIVVCCSLRADSVASVTELEGKWTSEQETAYKNGDTTGADEAERHDAARMRDELRPVYQLYGAPAGWNFLRGGASISVNAAATTILRSSAYQGVVRKTLPYLPLRDGVDYASPFGTVVAGHEGDFLGPQAWVYDPAEDRYHPADTVGVVVYASQYDYGVLLAANPNHLLALNKFSGAKAAKIKPKYDPDRMVATIAFESDHRLQMSFELVSGAGTKGPTFNVEVPDAELWYIAPNTIVGVNENGTLRGTSGGQVTRDDSARLALVMAGALARYNNERARATITIRGLWPWPFLLGQILTVIKQGTSTQTIRAAITEIEWRPGVGDRPEPVTIIRTGFAR